MTLSIIIVNWNVRDLLKKCLDSIFFNASRLDIEVIVIDNNSQDGSQKMLEEEAKKHPEIILILNKENLGFARANNQGIEKSRGEYVLLLNPDTEIIGDCLKNSVSYLKNNPTVGVLGCKIFNPEQTIQPSVRRLPALANQILILLKLHHLLPKLSPLKKYFTYGFDYTQTQKVEQVMGAFFLIRRQVLDKIGLLDENFFVWFEEVDFCQRAQKAGYEVVYFSEAAIIHQQSQSFKQVLGLKKQKQFNQSLLYYFKKHQPVWQWFCLWLLQPISLLLAFGVQVFQKITKIQGTRYKQISNFNNQ